MNLEPLSAPLVIDLARLGEDGALGRALLGQLPDVAVMVVDRGLRVVLAEGGAYARRALGVESYRGRRVPDLVPAPQWEALAPRYAAALAGEAQGFDHVSADGSLWHVTLAPFVDPGAADVAGVLVLCADVTSRRDEAARLRDAQALLSAAFERGPTAVVVIDLSPERFGLMTQVNEAAARYLDRPRDELQTMSFSAITHPEDVEADVAAVRAMAEDGLEVRGVQKRYVTATGAIRWGRLSTAIVRSADGRPAFTVAHVEDVTDARRDDEVLRRSRARFAGTFHDAPIGMAIIDVAPGCEGRLLDVNGALETMLGRPAEEIVGLRYHELCHPEDAEAAAAAIAAFLRDPVPGPLALRRFARPDGDVRWGRVSASLVSDEAGAPLHVVGMVADVTDQVEASRTTQRVVDGALEGIVVVDADGRIVRFNTAAERILGHTGADALGRSFSELVVPPDRREGLAGLIRRAQDPATDDVLFERERRVALHADGYRLPVELTLVRTRRDPLEITAFAHDLSEQQSAERRRREAEELFRNVFAASAVPMAITTIEGRWVEVNPAMSAFLGRSAEDLLALGGGAVTHPEDRGRVSAHIADLLAGRRERVDVEKRYVHADGRVLSAEVTATLLRDPTGEPRGMQVQILDVTERKRSSDMLRALLASVGDGVYATDGEGCIIFANPAAEQILGWTEAEMLGRNAHDLMHGEVSRDDCRITAAWRAAATARVDDDVFTRRDGTPVPVEYSVAPLEAADGAVGLVIAFSDISGRKAEELRLRRSADSLDRLSAVREALAEDRLILHTQPILDLATREVVQEELLVRMVDRDGTIVPPADFLPVAEEFGLIMEVDRWVIGQAAALAATGRHVEVNVSGTTLGNPDLPLWVERAIDEHDVDPALLTFEITETALVGDIEQAKVFAERLAALGSNFALDDFGTGYGTFTYLKQLPIDYLKIDMEFVRDLARQERDRHVVRAVVALATGFGQRTIAEGVEDAETLELLAELGVDYAQGFHIGRPGPLGDAR